MDTPLVALVMPGSMTDDCFRAQDLDRLAGRADLRIERPEAVDEPTACRLADGADVILTCWGTCALTDAVLARAPHLRLLAHAAGSIRGLIGSVPDFWSRGIRVTTANAAIAVGVAETCLGLMICGVRRVFDHAANTARGQWLTPEAAAVTRELFDLTVGVVAASCVGRHFIKLCRSFELNLLVYDPYLTADQARQLGATKVELDELLRTSDVVNCCLPNLPSTQNTIDAAGFQSMTDDAVFINASRGAVIDQTALIAELEKGRLFACLDVTDPEPPAPDCRLRTLPNCILTPHIAGAVANGKLRQGRLIADEVLRFLDGQPMHYEVAEPQFQRMA